MISRLLSRIDELDMLGEFPSEEAFFAYMKSFESRTRSGRMIDQSLSSFMSLTAQSCSDLLGESELNTEDWNHNPKNPQPILEDSEVDKKRGIASADAPLFYNKRWSSEFVHGSDAMFPIVKVGEKLLNPGEEITSITGGFDKIMKRDIHIEVRDMGIPDNSDMRYNNSIGRGELCTSHGRTLEYSISNLKTIVHEIRKPNVAATKIVTHIDETDDGLDLIIDPLKLQEIAKLSENPAYIASSLYEIATVSASYLGQLFLRDRDEDYTLTVIREIRNLGTRINVANISHNSSMRGRIRRSKTIGKWTYLFIELDIPFLDQKTEVIAAITHEEGSEA